MSGKRWLHGFRQRNPQLLLGLQEATSVARAEALNTAQAQFSFAILDKAGNEHKIHKTIIHMDESALTTVHIPPKALVRTDKKQVITSVETGVRKTVAAYINFGGSMYQHP
ncbi:hypothetical protein Trydic_g3428 [Trypoxylus dichotomus]